ncbi:MAG: lamin tail domain-containing protein [Candidatus Woesearchaeota archaeon]
MRKFIFGLLALILAQAASANVIITEVMYDPAQTASQTDSEWIEVYNGGDEPVDLSAWKVDNSAFEDIVLQPKQYLVIARELLDTDDTDNDSFETAWGNGNGVWDEDFLAVDGYFTLSDDDIINISNGVSSEVFDYDSSVGGMGGYSIIRVNYSLPNTMGNWAQGAYNGTPGRGEASEFSNEVEVKATVMNVPPKILQASIVTDDSSKAGIQVMPDYSGNKKVYVTMAVSDANGMDDIKEVGARLNSQQYIFNKVGEYNGTAEYNGSFEMSPTDIATFYSLNVYASDGISESSSAMDFEYLGILSSVIETQSLDFDQLFPGNISDEKAVVVRNTGNTVFDTEVEGFDLVSGDKVIPKSSLEVFTQSWENLGLPKLLDSNILPNDSRQIRLRLNVPSNVKAETFTGKLRVTSVAN